MPNPSYPKVISVMKRSGELDRRCRCRPVRYLNNIVEQDHRAIKRWVRASQGFRAFHSAWRTLQGIETMNMIRKGQVRWLPKDDVAGQVAFIEPCSVSTRPYNVHELRNTALLCSGLQHIPYDYRPVGCLPQFISNQPLSRECGPACGRGDYGHAEQSRQ